MKTAIHHVLVVLFAAVLLYALYHGLFAYSRAAITMQPADIWAVCQYAALGLIAAIGTSRQAERVYG